MNRRQKKKERYKRELFVNSFCSSYREVRKEDRFYHEDCINSKRAIKRCETCLNNKPDDEFFIPLCRIDWQACDYKRKD